MQVPLCLDRITSPQHSAVSGTQCPGPPQVGKLRLMGKTKISGTALEQHRGKQNWVMGTCGAARDGHGSGSSQLHHCWCGESSRSKRAEQRASVTRLPRPPQRTVQGLAHSGALALCDPHTLIDRGKGCWCDPLESIAELEVGGWAQLTEEQAPALRSWPRGPQAQHLPTWLRPSSRATFALWSQSSASGRPASA